MASHNVELLLTMYDAFNRGDLDTLMEHFSADAEQVVQVTGETNDGREAIRRSFEAYFDVVEEHRTDPLEFIETGEYVVIPVRLHGRLRHTGITDDMIPTEMTHAFTVREDKIVWNYIGATKDEAIEAVERRDAGPSL